MLLLALISEKGTVFTYNYFNGYKIVLQLYYNHFFIILGYFVPVINNVTKYSRFSFFGIISLDMKARIVPYLVPHPQYLSKHMVDTQ